MNKKILTTILSLVSVASMLVASPVYAQEDQLPAPGITPDSPLYFLDTFGKSLGLLFSSGPEAKAEKVLIYAGERLAEAQAMAAKNKSQALEKASKGYGKFIAIAAEKAQEARSNGASSNVSERVALATSKHLSVLDKVAGSFPEAVPERAREAISQAREASMKGTESALKGLAQENPGRAAEIAMNAAEARLNRAKAKAGENNTAEVEEAINDAEKLFGFAVEISAIAQELGKGETTVDQLIARATAIYLDVLADVLQKVPEQAKSAIGDAMTKAATARENAVERLKGAGALNNIPEELPIPVGIPDDVKDKLKQVGPSIPTLPAGGRP